MHVVIVTSSSCTSPVRRASSKPSMRRSLRTGLFGTLGFAKCGFQLRGCCHVELFCLCRKPIHEPSQPCKDLSQKPGSEAGALQHRGFRPSQLQAAFVAESCIQNFRKEFGFEQANTFVRAGTFVSFAIVLLSTFKHMRINTTCFKCGASLNWIHLSCSVQVECKAQASAHGR